MGMIYCKKNDNRRNWIPAFVRMTKEKTPLIPPPRQATRDGPLKSGRHKNPLGPPFGKGGGPVAVIKFVQLNIVKF